MLHKPPSPNPPDIQELVLAYQDGRDPRARDRLVRRCMPIIVAAATRWARSWNIDRDDAIQEGCIGALRAIELYDLEAGSLSHYVNIWVKSKVSRMRAEMSQIYVGAHSFLNDAGQAARSARRLREKLGRRPTSEEIAENTGFTVARVDKALAARTIDSTFVSTSAPFGEDETLTIGDTLEAPDRARPDVVVDEWRETAAARTAILQAAGTLKPAHRTVLAFRLVQGLTLDSVAERLGVSRERVRQLEAKVLAKMREALRCDLRALHLIGLSPKPRESALEAGIQIAEVQAVTGLSRGQIERWVDAGTFPAPGRDAGNNHRVWDPADVQAWLNKAGRVRNRQS